jgi:glutathione S-transferase
MILYYETATCSQAVHIMLREYGAAFETMRVLLPAKTLPDGSPLEAINPKNVVPALIDDSGRLWTEAVAILHQLPAILGETAAKPPEKQLEWLVFLTTDVHRAFGPLYHPDTPSAYIEITKAKIDRSLTYLEQYMTGREFVLESGFSASDAYLFVILGWAFDRGIPMEARPALTAFRSRIAERPAVQAALKAEGML